MYKKKMIEAGVFKNTHGAYMLRNLFKLSLFVIGVMSAPDEPVGGGAAATGTGAAPARDVAECIREAMAPVFAASQPENFAREGRATCIAVTELQR